MKGIEHDMVTAIVGGNWGDEGKGKLTDVCAADADFVIRFQGGANAGHTIINEYGKYVLHILPSGVFSRTRSISSARVLRSTARHSSARWQR